MKHLPFNGERLAVVVRYVLRVSLVAFVVVGCARGPIPPRTATPTPTTATTAAPAAIVPPTQAATTPGPAPPTSSLIPPIAPTPLPTSAVTPTAVPSASRASTPTRIAQPTPVATATVSVLAGATRVISRTTNGQTLYVANTDGLGVYLRQAPGSNDKLKVWPDDTPMVVVGPSQPVGGSTWQNVRDPDGDVGWIPSPYLTDTTVAVQDRQVEANSVLTFVGTPRYVPKANGSVVEGLIHNGATDTRSGILRALLIDGSGATVAVANGIVDDIGPGKEGVYELFTTQTPTSVARIVPQVVVSRTVTNPARIVIENVSVQPGPGGPLVVGTVRSVDNVPLTLALIAGYIAGGGQLSGTARGIVTNLQPGQSSGFTLKPDDSVASYNRVVVQIAAATAVESS